MPAARRRAAKKAAPKDAHKAAPADAMAPPQPKARRRRFDWEGESPVEKPDVPPWLDEDTDYPLPPAPKVWEPEILKRKPGRPTLFEGRPEAWPKLIWALRQGNTLAASAMFAGIARPTFHKLLQRGRKAQKKGEVGPWADFIDAVDQALVIAEVRQLGNIAFAGSIPKYWKASAYLLSVRNPKRYAPPSRVAHSDPTFKESAVFEMVLPNTRPSADAARTVDSPSRDEDDDPDMDEDE